MKSQKRIQLALYVKPVALGLLCLLALISGLIPGGWAMAQEQEQTSFTSMSVDLWPEFDRPSMLVMYQFSLSAQFKMPGEVRLRIPADVGAPNAVAVCDPSGSCFNTPYTQEQSGAWTTLVIQATMPDVRVEYYDPGLQKDGVNRRYEFVWPGDYAVNSFVVHVQQPAGARDMRLKPGTVSQRVADDGLTYYTLDAGAISAGQQVSLEIDYAKDSDALSTTSMPVSPSQPLTAPSGPLNISTSAPLVLGGVGIALIVGGGLWYWYSGRQRGRPKDVRRRTRRKPAPAAVEEETGPIYCHQCGNRAAPSDRFCRTCGTTLRKG